MLDIFIPCKNKHSNFKTSNFMRLIILFFFLTITTSFAQKCDSCLSVTIARFDGSLDINETVYVTSLDHNLYAINAETGQKKWAFATNFEIDASPIIAHDVVYVGSTDYSLYAIDAITGAEKMEF